MNRRSFLRTSTVLGCGLPFTSLISFSNFSINYKIHSGFTNAEKNLIERALQVLANRLTDDHICQNVYDILGNYGYYLDGGTWENSKLDAKPGYYKSYANLLEWQLRMLRTKGKRGEFPTINIYAYHKKEDIWAKAPLQTVKLVSVQRGTKFETHGQFKMYLNRWMLGADIKGGKDPEHWASVFAHEMLHNLGHDHERKNYDSWQINVFEKAIYWNGRYKKFSNSLFWSCG